MASVLTIPLEHPLIVLCTLGVVAGFAFWASQTLRESLLAHYVYVLILVALVILFGSRMAADYTSRLGAVAGVLLAMLGLMVGVAFNLPALKHAGNRVLTAIGRAVVGTRSMVVRKTYDQADAAMKREDYDAAAALYYRAIEKEPGDVEARRRLAEVFLKRGQPTSAASVLQEILDLSEDEQERCTVMFRLGEVLQDVLHEPEEAEGLYERIIRDYPAGEYAGYARARLKNIGVSGGAGHNHT